MQLQSSVADEMVKFAAFGQATEALRVPRLCRGSSGTVQLAQDVRTGRLVAIKFLHQGPGVDEKVIARELLNHKACAMHPHIVQLQARCLLLTQHLAFDTYERSCRDV